jgi:small subunit ribosomal protein S11
MGKKRIIKKGGAGSPPAGGGEKSAEKPRESEARQKISRGIAHIQATYNNTIISVSDASGNIIAWSSSGSLGFSGAKKATPYAAARVAETVAEKLRKTGLREMAVRVSGVGSGRDSAVRALANQGFDIIGIKDVTPLPHNGPRAKKVRRV